MLTLKTLRAHGGPPNMRLQLAGALVLMEAVGSCPGRHGNSSIAGSAGASVARS